MFRLTEPVKNVKFDFNLDPNLNFSRYRSITSMLLVNNHINKRQREGPKIFGGPTLVAFCFFFEF